LLTDAAPAPLGAERELVSTPFFPQEVHQCGPAALATVLGASGVDMTPGTLASQVYVPALRGSLQVELLAASRRAGRIAYPIEPDLDALLDEIDAGRPVLVLQNLGLELAPRWHYAVVVGYSQRTGDVVLRSGRTERALTSASHFERTWSRAGHWGFVVLAPGDLPARVDHDRYVAAVAAFESAGNGANALPAWQRGEELWPESDTVLLGFGNALVAAGERRVAERCYRSLVDRAPDQLAARNNLAFLLGERGCVDAALATLDPAIEQAAADERWLGVLSETRSEIQARGADADRCATDEPLARTNETPAYAGYCLATTTSSSR
jgi:tetratricopeptide (TPR) repeat protein